jgi:nicotine blue oxidoreductase
VTGSESSVAGLVLAAGAGARFGRPKALVEIDGELLVDRTIRLLTAGGCRPIYVVLGAGLEEVTASARLDAAIVVVADDWVSGMAASLHAGLAHVSDSEAVAVVVALVDQPWIGPAAVERLLAAFESGASAAVATYDGEPRNPVLLAREVWSEVVASTSGDVGARSWLRQNPERVRLVACDGTGDPRDVDTSADL